MIDGLKTVSCVYTVGTRNTYTYKTMLDIKEGEKVVVKNNDGSYKIVTAIEDSCEADIDIDAEIDYSWVMCILDESSVESYEKQEEEILISLKKQQRSNAVLQARQALANDLGIGIENLSEKLTTKNEE